eukprot:SAG22_NODE_85_length_21510_cov_6.472187_15_plen_133_part_00
MLAEGCTVVPFADIAKAEASQDGPLADKGGGLLVTTVDGKKLHLAPRETSAVDWAECVTGQLAKVRSEVESNNQELDKAAHHQAGGGMADIDDDLDDENELDVATLVAIDHHVEMHEDNIQLPETPKKGAGA